MKLVEHRDLVSENILKSILLLRFINRSDFWNKFLLLFVDLLALSERIRKNEPINFAMSVCLSVCLSVYQHAAIPKPLKVYIGEFY
jgi:hypothetical protein